MSDNKKYYYLKLKENFFDTDEMVILESMQDGHLYSNILLKLYLRSLKNEGKLMFNDRIPYSPTALAQVTRHSVGVVEKALSLFRELGLVEILDNGAIYMTDIQNFIGESSTEADRKRLYRKRIEHEKLLLTGQTSDKCPDKSPPEFRDKSLELELEIEKDLVVSKDTTCSSNLLRILEEWNSLNISTIKKLSPNTNRYTLLKARIKEYGEDEVIRAIQNIKTSSFLRGQNDKGWTISFDWLIKPNNFMKVLEGNYTDKGDVKSSGRYEKDNGKYDPYAEAGLLPEIK